MHKPCSWKCRLPRDAHVSSPTLLGTSFDAPASTSRNIMIVSSTSSDHRTRVIAIVLGSMVSLFLAGTITLVILKQWTDRRRLRAHAYDLGTWRDRQGEAMHDGTGTMGMGTNEIFLPVSPDVGHVSSASSEICSLPVITLPPGWPSRDFVGEDDDRRLCYGYPRNPRSLLVDTPFEAMVSDESGQLAWYEEIGYGRRSLSSVQAVAGSAGPSTAPSRAASRIGQYATQPSEKFPTHFPPPAIFTRGRRPLPDIPTSPPTSALTPRHRRASSLWSWSHRATYHEDERGSRYPDLEQLPAYPGRRSRSRSMSTTRSRSRHREGSRRSSMLNVIGDGTVTGRGSNALLNPPEYPFELGRKVAQAYRQEPRTPPPPGYNS